LQLSLQPFGAVTVSAAPRLGAVLVFAITAVMSVLYTSQLEELLPKRTLFEQRSRTVANLHPPNRLIGFNRRFPHVPQIFTFSYGPFTERGVFNRPQKRGLATGFDTRFY